MNTMKSENHDALSRHPEIDINVSCEGWPAETVILALSGQAVSSVIKVAELSLPADAVLSLLFSDDDEIATLNGQFRNIHQPTNVLSFPGTDVRPGEIPDMVLGDIAFALQTIEREAVLENKEFDHHLSHLIVHGFLHLFGYDHICDKDALIMESFETRALALLGIKGPYLEQ